MHFIEPGTEGEGKGSTGMVGITAAPRVIAARVSNECETLASPSPLFDDHGDGLLT